MTKGIARGVNARIDNIGPRQMNTAGNAEKQPGMVGRDHADESGTAFFINLAMDR